MNVIQAEELRLLIEFDRICRKYDIIYSLSFGTLIGAIRHQGFIPWDDDVDVSMTRSEYNKFLAVVEKELHSDFFFQTKDTDPMYLYTFAKLRSRNLDFKEMCNTNIKIQEGVWLDIFIADAISDNDEEVSQYMRHIAKEKKKITWMVHMFADGRGNAVNQAIKKTVHLFNKLTVSWNPLPHKIYRSVTEYMQQFNGKGFTRVSQVSSSSNYDEMLRTICPESELLEVIDWEFEGHTVYVPQAYHKSLTSLYGDYMKLPDEADRVSVHDIVQ